MVLPNRQQKDDAAIDYDYEHRCAEHEHDCGHEHEYDSDRSQPAGRASGGGGIYFFAVGMRSKQATPSSPRT